jgi:hypothetical protein
MDINVIPESGFDDIQNVITNIQELSKQYVGPIDILKSIYKPAPSNSTSASQQVAQVADININNPPESRTHCFYRMVGFPVLAPDGSFYNPGYEPNSNKNADSKAKINSKFLANTQLTIVMQTREFVAILRRMIFANQDIGSTAYALALRYCKTFSGYFDQSSMGIDPLKGDPQVYSVNDRITALNNFYQNNSITTTAGTFDKQTHILRPFVVDPLIDQTVNPVENRICVPFLNTKEDTKINAQADPLKRPIIEFICRLRLQQTNQTDTYFAQQALSLINGSTASSDSSVQDIKDTILALTNSNNVSELQNNTSFQNIINNFSDIQTATLEMLIKAIKGLAFQLDETIRDLDIITRKIDFQPIPDQNGPEFGGTIRTTINSVYDQKIANLTILNLNNQRQQQVIADKLGGGNELFASAVLSSSQKNYKGEIDKLQRQKSDLSQECLDDLADIERIVGEVSGLGLIDILAIYTALWAIDIDSLIALLDDNAFQRLYDFNPELRNANVEARHSSGVSPVKCIDALKNFEINLFNILSFADKIIEIAGSSPSQNTGSYIY